MRSRSVLLLLILIVAASGAAYSAAQGGPDLYLPWVMAGLDWPLPTPTATATATGTPTGTPTATASVTPSATATPTATFTPTATPSRTASPTATATLTATATSTPAPAADVRVVLIDGEGEYVVVRNVGTGGQVMSGWWLRSYDGGSCEPLVSQTFYWPSGYVLGAGQSVRVTSGPNAVDNPPAVLRWTMANVWANGGDRGDLHDASGGLRSWLAYGSCR